MKVGGICGCCNKYYVGEVCNNSACESAATGSTLQVINDIQPHYNRGLGMFINSRAQYRSELKERGLTEVGNEKAYVSPEYNEKLQERKTEALYKGLREQAYREMGRSDARWN